MTSRYCSCTPRTSAAPSSRSSRPDELVHRRSRLLHGLGGGAAHRAALGRARAGRADGGPRAGRAGAAHAARSEEHTSELQSLMRISYAVFCLKKQKQTTEQTTP